MHQVCKLPLFLHPISSLLHKVSFPDGHLACDVSGVTVNSSQGAAPKQFGSVGPVADPGQKPNVSATDANSIAVESLKVLGSIMKQGFTLPKRKLLTFDGIPLEYYGFIKSFEETIREQIFATSITIAILDRHVYWKGT